MRCTGKWNDKSPWFLFRSCSHTNSSTQPDTQTQTRIQKSLTCVACNKSHNTKLQCRVCPSCTYATLYCQTFQPVRQFLRNVHCVNISVVSRNTCFICLFNIIKAVARHKRCCVLFKIVKKKTEQKVTFTCIHLQKLQLIMIHWQTAGPPRPGLILYFSLSSRVSSVLTHIADSLLVKWPEIVPYLSLLSFYFSLCGHTVDSRIANESSAPGKSSGCGSRLLKPTI